MRAAPTRHFLTAADISVATDPDDLSTDSALNSALRGHLLAVLVEEDATCPVAGFGAPQVQVFLGGHAAAVEWPYLRRGDGFEIRLRLEAVFDYLGYAASARFVVANDERCALFAALPESHPMASRWLFREPMEEFQRGTFAVFVRELIRFVGQGLCEGFMLHAARADEALEERSGVCDPFVTRF